MCTAKYVDEKILERAFIDSFNRLKVDNEGFIETLSKNIEKVLSQRVENTDLIEIENKIEYSKEEFNEYEVVLKNISYIRYKDVGCNSKLTLVLA